MKSAETFWDKAAARYAKSPIRGEASYQKKLAITRDYFQPDWSVLEFGCGTGGTAILHAPYVRDILATDISKNMLEIAQAKAADAGIGNIRFQQGTLDSLPLAPGSFDSVLGLNILHLLKDPDAAIGRVSSLLKPGGIFVANTVLAADMKLHWRLLIPLMQALGFAPHVSRFGRDELFAMLARAGFDINYEWQPDSLSAFIVARKRA